MTKKHQEKVNREIRVLIQQSLYDKLQQKCDDNYKTLSEVIRDLVNNYLKEGKWYEALNIQLNLPIKINLMN